MGIETVTTAHELTNRRQWLARHSALALAAFGVPGLARAASPGHFVAAWEADEGYRVGVLGQGETQLTLHAALAVPTRAHGVLVESTGTLLAVARRPGDWLLRWTRDGRDLAWHWIEPDRAFNGHVIASADGHRLYTTESDLETGHGLIGVRDAASLEKLAEWPTHGMDPHELLLDADGTLLVANGGIPALPETGRSKIHLDRMDASVVRLDTHDGQLRGQWRLVDKRLSLRHIAWGQDATSGRRLLGIALQAEHADAQARLVAPVLAVFDGRQLHAVPAPQPLAGYGGDIAFAGGAFAVSCPRADRVVLFDAHEAGGSRWAGAAELPEACALAVVPAGTPSARPALWAGGRDHTLALQGETTVARARLPRTGAPIRLDNHWTPLAA